MNLLVLANNTALTRAKHVEVINPEDNLLTLTPVSFAVAAGLFGVFVLARVVHSVCYVKGIQPWRTAFFGIGALAQLGVLGYLGSSLVGA